MYCLDFDQSILSVVAPLRDFLNSQFVSASLSALAGAGLGVWGAKRVADRATERKELLDSLRQANALTVLAATIANQTLSLKKQHVKELAANYFADRERAEAFNNAVLSGNPANDVLHFKAEMLCVTPLTLPIEALKSLTLSSSLIPGKALAILSVLEQAIAELNSTISQRTQYIDAFRREKLPQDLFAQRYFGLQQRDGSIDRMFHDLMVALRSYTDDVAFFASEFAEELQAHAERLRVRVAKIHKNPPKATKVDFSNARESGLIPPKEEYSDWSSGFKVAD
jgi:hypothetical protein